jgi:NAD(P)-dependent dehydrogenase (short-subunit alcohol dehydrogenase family)
MRAKLKPLDQQVVVVTGAGGGIGLAIAQGAAAAGAAVVLTGRDESALRKAAEAINAGGGRAHPVAGDLADPEATARIARAAIARFGGFDAWINGPDNHDLATATATREAARHFRGRPGGGAVVNLAATPSNLSQALRRELARAPVSLTEIRLPELARLEGAAEVVAAAALYAAGHPLGRMAVSASGKRLSFYTAAQKHRGALLGAGLVALAAAAAWYGRGRIGQAVRPLVLEAAWRRPITSVKLVARHPRRALRLANALR